MVNLAFDLGGWRQLDPQRSNGAVYFTLDANTLGNEGPFDLALLTNDNFDAMHISLQLTVDLQGSLGQNGDPLAQYGQTVADDRCCQRCLGRWWTNGRGGR